MRATIIIVILLWASSGLADVYKWVDENGVVQYADRPLEGDAQQVKLPPASFYKPPEYQPPAPAPQAADQKPAYERVALAQPELGATVRDNTGDVPVAVELTPALRYGDTLTILLDGRTIFDKVTTPQLVLGNVDRGTHQIVVKVMDATGHEVAATPAVTFHLHRAIAPKPQAPSPKPGK
jgi:hypothetical protein